MDALLSLIFKGMIFVSVVLFAVGIVKPEWMRFWKLQPARSTIIGIAAGILVMGFLGAGAIQFARTSNYEATNRGRMLGEAVYAINESTIRCERGEKSGTAGVSHDEKTPAGIRYMVKTPVNYDSNIAHPLLMVYAPGGRSRFESENSMHLTQEATEAGFIIAYADHRKMSAQALSELAEIPGLIETKWCIDKKRIFLTGHSDGATTAMGIAFLSGTKHIPAAIAPSAVGIRAEDLKEYQCPNPLPVMVMHSSHDKLFPGYGKEAIQWWAVCNGCDTASLVKDAEGCTTYTGCKNNVATRYCEGTGSHSEWPEKNRSIIDFFKAVNK
jgi:polyhydroxybutyrate depolymerase